MSGTARACCQLPASGWLDSGLVLNHSRRRLGQKIAPNSSAMVPILIHVALLNPPGPTAGVVPWSVPRPVSVP
jgi:hypothetical protein